MNNAATTGAAHVAQRVNENRSGFESDWVTFFSRSARVTRVIH